MKKILLLFVFLGLFSCGVTKIIPVETKTVSGQPVTETSVPKTAKRDDVPVGVKPSQVEAVIKTKTGAEIYITKKHGQPVIAYENKEAIAEGITITQPEKSWAWLYWTIGVMVFLVAGMVVLKSYFGVNPFGWLFKKILR